MNPSESSDCAVVIVDDHELFSTTLMISLRERGIAARKIGVAHLAEFAAQRCPVQCGLVVLDLYLGHEPSGERILGSSWVRTLRTNGWHVLMVSGSDDQAGIAAAIAEGAIGSVPKSSSFERLLHTILPAAQGKPLLTEAERRQWIAVHNEHEKRRRARDERLGSLTTREREVLELLAEGHRADVIAKKFVVSLATVRTQIRSIFTKLDVNSQLQAVAVLRGEQVE
jgi:DNA-binding NarL/FixJ family response regulator